jgi:hypothetical protein
LESGLLRPTPAGFARAASNFAFEHRRRLPDGRRPLANFWKWLTISAASKTIGKNQEKSSACTAFVARWARSLPINASYTPISSVLPLDPEKQWNIS